MPQDPPILFTLKRMQLPYQSKTVGAGRDICLTTCIFLRVSPCLWITLYRVEAETSSPVISCTALHISLKNRGGFSKISEKLLLAI